MARRIAILGMLCLAVAAGVFFYVRTNPSRAKEDRERRRAVESDLFDRGQQAFASLSIRPIGEIASAEELRQVLSGATVFTPLPAEGGGQDELLSHVAEFLYYRFVQADPALYRQWRSDNGYGMIPWADLVGFWGLDEDYEANFGRPPPTDIESADAFDEFWRFDAGGDSPYVGPATAIAADGRGIVIGGCMYSRVNPTRPRLAGDPARGGFEADLWDGRSMSGWSRWYSSRYREPRLDRTWILSDEAVPFADVAIVIRFRDGTFVPMRVACAWDAQRRCWSIESLGAGNLPAKGIGPKVF